nr:fatty-acid--CoA ligase [Sulfurospirillum arcachonense]
MLTLVYLLAIGLYVYSFSGDTYTLEVYKFSLNLPIAIWIILPAVLLFVASIFHMMYYSMKEFWRNRSLVRDFENFKVAFGEKVLGEDSSFKFKTDYFKFISNSIKMVDYKEVDNINIEDEKIETLRQVVKDINEGKVVELKKYKLSADNKLIEKNKFNKLADDPKYATTILKECKDEKSELCQKAYFEFLKYASFDEIKKVGFSPSKEMFRVLMERYLDEEDKFEMDLASIEELLMNFKASREDYLELAYEIKIKLAPDSLIALFEKLYNSPDHVAAADAYLYVLYELQMIDKIRDILDNSDEDEFKKFKTLLFLRDHGKNVDSGIFLRFS